MILGFVGIGSIMGLGGYCYNKKAESSNEGGCKEDRKLFEEMCDAESGEKPILDKLLPTW